MEVAPAGNWTLTALTPAPAYAGAAIYITISFVKCAPARRRWEADTTLPASLWSPRWDEAWQRAEPFYFISTCRWALIAHYNHTSRRWKQTHASTVAIITKPPQLLILAASQAAALSTSHSHNELSKNNNNKTVKDTHCCRTPRHICASARVEVKRVSFNGMNSSYVPTTNRKQTQLAYGLRAPSADDAFSL